MRTWELAVALDRKNPEPLFLQIARSLSDDIRRGRLRPGEPLPGTRQLAETLGVHRNTVLAAYAELAAEGWTETARARLTRVSPALPERPLGRSKGPKAGPTGLCPRTGYDLPPMPERTDVPTAPPGVLTLQGGVPDVRLVPRRALARAFRRALDRDGRALLGYGDPRGDARLRQALAAMIARTRGLAASASDVVVLRGSQMGLDLCSRALIAPGDVVAVEAWGYPPAWQAFRRAGARLVPLPVDESGLSVDALAALCRRERVRAVYVTPHHQYPTTVTLSAARRLELAELARRERVVILEDDYDHEFHYQARPVLPLASADAAGVVVYIGTLSKVLAPGLRTGYVVAPRPLCDLLVAHRLYVDRQGDLPIERALALLLEEGEVERHARRARRHYLARRDALGAALAQRLGGALSFALPPGGMALWAQAAPDIDVERWAARGQAKGVVFHTARRFAFDGQVRPFVRIGFAALEERELLEAVRRMATALAGR
jgi:GntR family transcriptional regulator/MocR family aminotransferase